MIKILYNAIFLPSPALSMCWWVCISKKYLRGFARYEENCKKILC